MKSKWGLLAVSLLVLIGVTGCVTADQSGKAVVAAQDAGKKAADAVVEIGKVAPALIESGVNLFKQSLDAIQSISGAIRKPNTAASESESPPVAKATPEQSVQPIDYEQVGHSLRRTLAMQWEHPDLLYVTEGDGLSPGRIVYQSPLRQ